MAERDPEPGGGRERRPPMGVEVLRGGRVESVHQVDLAVLDAGGAVVASAGSPETAVFVRSAVKPFQALPLVADGAADALGLSDEALALCCASHSSEPEHVALAREILAGMGLDEEALACGPHEPFSGAAARSLHAEGREPGRIHNNCSGKHAGMLALARHHGWPTAGYHEAGHPVQERILEELERWTGVGRDAMPTGVDGCGVVTVALPLTALARAFARLGAAAEETGSPAARVLGAMAAHPRLVAGSKRLCTELMEATGGRVVAKVGAEGVYAAVARDRGWGIALKARDGARRAAETALMGVLAGLELLSPEEAESLARWLRRPVPNTRGEVVGELRPSWEVARAGQS